MDHLHSQFLTVAAPLEETEPIPSTSTFGPGTVVNIELIETDPELKANETSKSDVTDLNVSMNSKHANANDTSDGHNGEPTKRRKVENRDKQGQCRNPVSEAGSEIIVNASSTDVPPEDRVFSIHFLMLKIFSHLEPRHLKICRQVSHRWNSYAIPFLHKNQSLALEFVSSYRQDIHSRGFKAKIQKENQTQSEFTLEALTELMSKSTNPFPSTFFCFNDGNLNNPALQNFLNIHGATIEKLRLDVFGLQRGKAPELSSLVTLLFDQVPNLQYLRLDDLPETWLVLLYPGTCTIPSTSSGAGSTLHFKLRSLLKVKSALPKLKCVEFEDEIPHIIFDFITRAATNLEQVFLRSNKNLHFYFDNYDHHDKPNKLHLLKHLYFSPSVDSMETYVQLVKLEPNCASLVKLKQIDFSFDQVEYRPDLWSAVGQLLCDILRRYCDTVEKIRWQPIRFLPADSLKESNFPVMPKVKVLKIEKNHSVYRYGLRRDRGVFPKNLCLSQTFPNLHTIKFYISNVGRSKYHRDMRDPMTNYFNSDNFNASQPLLTVKKFCINDCDSYPLQLWEEFPKIFCNLETVVFGGIRDFSKVSKALWTFSKLKEIDLYFDMGYFEEEEECYLFTDECTDAASSSNNCFGSQTSSHNQLSSLNPLNGSLDPGFTGFSPETCEKLRQKPCQNSKCGLFRAATKTSIGYDFGSGSISSSRSSSTAHPVSSSDTVSSSGAGSSFEAVFSSSSDPHLVCVSNLEQLRTKPSIVDLKGLRRLKLGFIDDTEVTRDEDDKYFLFVSDITGLYAFQMCPKLEISVLVEAEDVGNIGRIKELVKPLRSYVHFGPW